MKNTIKNSIVTFDFDGCISDYFGGEINPRKSQIKDWIKRLIRRGYDIHIVTRRFGPYASSRGDGNEHVPVFAFADLVCIPHENVHFTDRDWKYGTIDKLESSIHLDDDITEQQLINKHLSWVTAICVEDKNWELQLINRLSKNDDIKIWISREEDYTKVLLFFAILFTIIVFSL